MRIEKVAARLAHATHLRLGLLRRRDTAFEVRPELRLRLVIELVTSLRVEVVHESRDLARVSVVQDPQEALNIGRLADVHRRRVRDGKLLTRIIHARRDESREDVVHVRRDDELANRRTQELRIIRRENVAEVSARHHDVKLPAELRARQNVIRDLRHQPPRVDRVGARQRDAVRRGFGVDLRIGKDALHGGLRIVKVAPDADSVHVPVRRCRHLQALNLRGAGRGIEHDDLRAVHSGEALHRGTSRVAACRGEDEDALAVRRMLHEDRQHRQRHVLEGARLAVEELEDVEPVLLDERNRVVLRKALAQPVRRGASHLRRQIVKERLHHKFLSVTERRDRLQPTAVNGFRSQLRYVKPPVRRQPLKHRLGARRLKPFSRTDILHLNLKFLIS